MNGPVPHHRQQSITRLIHEAEEAWAGQDYRKCIARMKEASRLDPNNPSLLLQVARAHGLRYDYLAAEKWIERAVQAWPQRAEALTEAGRTCLEFDQVDLATRYLERASHEPDVTIGTLATLGDICVRDRRLDMAAELADRAAMINSGDARVSLLRARVLLARGDLEGAESLLRAALSGRDVPYAVQVRGIYELADILNRTGRFEEAMAELLRVKELQRPHAAPCLPAAALAQERGREMERTITTEVLDRWRAATKDLVPNRRIALLCGHPRSGTTLLEQVLDAHPGVTSAEETKLMHDEAYLPVIRDVPEGTDILNALDPASRGLLRSARDNYFRCAERLLGCTIDDRLLIDKNPALNMLIPMVVRIFPETHFIVALRDPRDVVLSCFMQALPLTPVSCAYLSFEATVRQYAAVMGFWLRMRPRLGDRWIEVRYEELVDDLPAVSRRVLPFLGLEFDEVVLRHDEHARSKRINSPSHADVRKPVYRTAVGRWQHYREHLEPHLATLEPFLKAFGYS
jgi:tetratricopeptide (TPR) repeat protein